MSPIGKFYEGFVDSFFVLSGSWTDIEGFAPEWREIVKVLRNGGRVSFNRCACKQLDDGSFELWSPRNCMGDDDCAKVPADDAGNVAAVIEETIGPGADMQAPTEEAEASRPSGKAAPAPLPNAEYELVVSRDENGRHWFEDARGDDAKVLSMELIAQLFDPGTRVTVHVDYRGQA